MKKLLSVILSITILLAVLTPIYADGIDGSMEESTSAVTVPAPSEWARASIDKARELGVTETEKAYYYAEPITREEFCELIYNFVNICADLAREDERFVDAASKVDLSEYVNGFLDTANEKVLTLNALGIINGKSENEFHPNDFLTREEAAVILERMIKCVWSGIGITQQYIVFADADEISDWAENSIQDIYKLGIMNGVGNDMFAPKATFTTEQAVATIIRIYEKRIPTAGAEVKEAAAARLELRDGIAVDDFYIDEALKLTKEAASLAATEEFVAMYTSSEEMKAEIAKIAGTDFSKPEEIYYVSLNREQIIANIKAMYSEETELRSIEKIIELNKFNLAVLANMVNASYGANSLAALTVLANSEGYIMPEDFDNDFALLLRYDGGYSSFVSFSKIGEEVIAGNMSFVVNGDKVTLFSYLSEIAEAFGDTAVTVGRVN